MVRFASRESRTVSTLRGSSGAATGYSVPPIVPKDQMSERNFVRFLREHEVSAQKPVMVLPFPLQSARRKLQRIVPGASHCQPRLTIVKPLRSSHASPASSANPNTAIDQGDDTAAAAIGNFQHQRAVSLGRIFRADGHEIGREFDLAVFQIHGFFEIDDAPIVLVGDEEREVDTAGDAFIGTYFTKCFTAENVHTRRDFHASHASIERRRTSKQK